METKTDILNELKYLSPLIAGLDKVNVYTVPPGYFDSVPATLLACLAEENNSINLPENNQSSAVPDGYFDQLAGSILDKIRQDEKASGETRELSPLLFSLQNKQVFEVPDGYFENLSGFIAAKIKSSTAKVISIHKRNLFIKYAVAAMMTGIVALGVYRFTDKTDSSLSIENTVVNLDASIEKGKNMNDKQFNETLGNLSETDIAKYLETNGDIADVAVLRNNLDVSNLPTQEDYLLDETTLDKYLQEIEQTNLSN